MSGACAPRRSLPPAAPLLQAAPLHIAIFAGRLTVDSTTVRIRPQATDRGAVRYDWRVGPDSLVPRWRDLAQLRDALGDRFADAGAIWLPESGDTATTAEFRLRDGDRVRVRLVPDTAQTPDDLRTLVVESEAGEVQRIQLRRRERGAVLLASGWLLEMRR